MNLLPLLKKTLNSACIAGLASHARRGVLETLEPRTVLSGFGMQPMMDHHDGGRHPDSPPGGHEERFLGPEFGGPQFGARDFGVPHLRPPPGDFGRPMPDGGDFGFPPPPRPTLFPPTEGGGAQPQVPVSVSRVELPPAVASFAAAGLSSLSDAVLTKLPAAQSESQAFIETERFKIRLISPDRDGTDRDAPLATEAISMKPVRHEPDGLIELLAEEMPQRIRRKAIRIVEIEPKHEDQPESLLAQLEGVEVAPVLRQQEIARDTILTAWPVSLPSSAPESESLIEIVAESSDFGLQPARDDVSQSRTLRYSAASTLKAEVGVVQVLELASQPLNATESDTSATQLDISAIRPGPTEQGQ